jgi:hypothetical protein
LAPELIRQPVYEVFAHSGIACRAGTKADAVILHAKAQFLTASLKANADASRPAIRKRMLDRIRNKLVDD